MDSSTIVMNMTNSRLPQRKISWLSPNERLCCRAKHSRVLFDVGLHATADMCSTRALTTKKPGHDSRAFPASPDWSNTNEHATCQTTGVIDWTPLWKRDVFPYLERTNREALRRSGSGCQPTWKPAATALTMIRDGRNHRTWFHHTDDS